MEGYITVQVLLILQILECEQVEYLTSLIVKAPVALQTKPGATRESVPQ